MSFLSNLATRLRQPRLRDRILLLGVGGISLLCSACLGDGHFGFLGYTTNSNYDRRYRTIRVPIFANRTFYRGLEFEVTDELIKAIERTTPYKVVSGDADMELTGTILTYLKVDILQNPLNEVREADTTMIVEIHWRDLRTGELLSKPQKRPGGPAETEIVPDLEAAIASGVPSAPIAPGSALGQPGVLGDPNAPPGSQPLPILPPPPGTPAKPPGVIVRSTAGFIPELGESITTARNRASIRMATAIVQMMEKPW